MSKNKRTKVRFHLGAGKNFMHWKIEYPNGDYQFVDPKTTNMVLYGCQLHNQKGTAKRINEGSNKTVCAWVWCDWISMRFMTDKGVPVSYNPRVQPNWVFDGQNADNMTFDRLQTVGNKLIAY